MIDCNDCNGEEEHKKHSVCPNCENSGFDGQGQYKVGTVTMYRKRCWSCGHRFAVEVKQ